MKISSLIVGVALLQKAALEHLRFNKNHAAVNQPSISNGQPSKSYYPPSYPPPQQSRDATTSSHYFYNPPNMGNVLVPSSSPILQPAQPNYTPYSHSPVNDTPQTAGFASHSSQSSSGVWGAYGGYPAADPLSAPTGFTVRGGAPYMSPNHSSGSNSGRSFPGANGHYEEGPPRKRLNRGPDSNDSLDLFAVPSTPQSIALSPPGHLTRDASMQSSDDELPRLGDMASSSSSRRIIRNGAGASTASPILNASQSSEDEDMKRFTRFKMMQPMEAPGRVRAAWEEAEGDDKKASALLCNPNWSPKTTASPTLSRREITGRVKEIDDATKAQRAATKEKGKKSMIYANRSVLETKVQVTPQAVKTAAIDLATPNTPTSPDVRMPRRRLIKRRVDSESEAENSDASENRKVNLKAKTLPLPTPTPAPIVKHKHLSGEAQALSYFNTKNAEGLQEITG
jgi:SWI/SNF-related matrix-associated actin-dependent regulator of chromatin subfamily A containing DEAD/H box 1